MSLTRRVSHRRTPVNRDRHFGPEGSKLVLRAEFPPFDPYSKPRTVFGHTCGPPGTGKSTNWALAYNHSIYHHLYGIRPRNVHCSCASSYSELITDIVEHAEARYHLCLLEDAFDAARSVRKGRWDELALTMRVRHVLGRARKDLGLPMGALIVIESNCQTLSGLDKAYRAIMHAWRFKFLGADKDTRAETKTYLQGDELAERYTHAVGQLCQSPDPEESLLGRASFIWWNMWGGLGSACTLDISHHMRDREWEVPVSPDDLPGLKHDQQEARVWELTGQVVEACGLDAAPSAPALEVYFSAQGVDVASDEVALVARRLRGLADLHTEHVWGQVAPLLPIFQKHQGDEEPQPAQLQAPQQDTRSLGEVFIALFEQRALQFGVPYNAKILCAAFPDLRERVTSASALSVWVRDNQVALERALKCGITHKQLGSRRHWTFSRLRADVEAARARAALADQEEDERAREALSKGLRFAKVT